jgi:glutamate/tyrosine decarboxylase-like PLP-dependent enzyme
MKFDSKELLETVAARSIRYLANLDARCLSPSHNALRALAQFSELLPPGPTNPNETLALLDEVGSPATVATAGGRYFGFVTGGSLPVALAANWLAGAWDQNSALVAMSPVGAALEEVALQWLVEIFGLPRGTGAGFVTGATMANFTALAAARHAVLEQSGWDVDADGLFGAPPISVVVGEEVHVSLLKALGMLGLGRNRVLRVPADNQGRMRADALPRWDGPAILCIQAGNVNSGAFDPAEPIIAAAKKAGAWIHVDGAFGLWAAASPKLHHLLNGFEAAHSWAVDAHKWLNVPYDSGIAFVREPRHLRKAMAINASYFEPGSKREPDQHTPEMSRRARGVEIWAALRTLGRAGVADLVERACRFAAFFAERLRKAGCEILNEVVLNQVLVAFGDDETTRRVIADLQEDGTCWCGGTVWHGRAAMRISVSSWATTEQDVERSLEAILRVASIQGSLARK